jgi:hypothetical protein
MFERLPLLGALAAALSACGDGPATVAGTWRSPAAWSVMVHATAAGPMLVEVVGDPFAAGSGFAAAVAEAMDNQVIGRPIRFTVRRDQAPRPGIRVIVAFDPPPSADARELCAGKVSSLPPEGGRVRVLAAFCDGDGALLSSVSGRVKADSPADKRFRQLLAQVVRALFGDGG